MPRTPRKEANWLNKSVVLVKILFKLTCEHLLSLLPDHRNAEGHLTTNLLARYNNARQNETS